MADQKTFQNEANAQAASYSATAVTKPKPQSKVNLISYGVIAASGILFLGIKVFAPSTEQQSNTTQQQPSTQSDAPVADSSSNNFSTPADDAAKQDLQSNSWVKELFVSPGHMNIGVIRTEKEWSSPMIGQYACGVLRKHGSKLKWVRFVDIKEVVNQGKTPNQAEIYKVTCP